MLIKISAWACQAIFGRAYKPVRTSLLRVISTFAPSSSNFCSRAFAIARFTSFSSVPAGPIAPVSNDECPASTAINKPFKSSEFDSSCGGLRSSKTKVVPSYLAS
ncbi:MAG: hypothetical protein A3J83_06775 [Elusimicrobia bacterium RIFOXYA2_FULL_40_6]|nr:MAG: hypothetical protein A3J83_06775 [Elusimicrobia bacterium RIFOXYA2_FULL_40_6]